MTIHRAFVVEIMFSQRRLPSPHSILLTYFCTFAETNVTSNAANLVQTMKMVRSTAPVGNLSIQTTTNTSILPNIQSQSPPSLAPISTNATPISSAPTAVTNPVLTPGMSNLKNQSIKKKPTPVPEASNHITQAQTEAVLANEPPGTIIKCITAQVIQSPQGPRIVLQGLQGSNFSPEQLQLIQQEVKRELLRSK